MAIFNFYDALTSRLRASGDYVWPLLLRLIMAWEFWESGLTKLNGQNWFGEVPWADWQIGFPYPFDQIPVSMNWFLATWGELVFAAMLLLGLFTRFAAISLIVITVVALLPSTGRLNGTVLRSCGAVMSLPPKTPETSNCRCCSWSC